MKKHLLFAWRGNPGIYRWYFIGDEYSCPDMNSFIEWSKNDTLKIEILPLEEVSPDDLLEWPEDIPPTELELKCEEAKKFYFICGENKELLLVGHWINYPWWIEDTMSFYVNIYKNDDIDRFLKPPPVYTQKEKGNAYKDLHDRFKIHKIYKKAES